MIAEIDKALFARTVHEWLAAEGLTTRTASAAFEGINPAMVSRAVNCHVLSAASLLAICRAMEADPLRFLRFHDPRQQNQTVTAIDKRETEAMR